MSESNEVLFLVQIQGLYDGWAYKIMKDGTLVNRWDKEEQPELWRKTQEVIEKELKNGK